MLYYQTLIPHHTYGVRVSVSVPMSYITPCIGDDSMASLNMPVDVKRMPLTELET